MLEERVERGGTFGFGEDFEPLFNGGEFFFKVCVERSSCHFFEGGFVVLEVFKPLVEGFGWNRVSVILNF